MPKIKLSDGKSINFDTTVNGLQISEKISKSLSKQAMIMRKDYNSLKSIGFEGRKNVLKRFDVDKMCQTTFTEYKKLIKLS